MPYMTKQQLYDFEKKAFMTGLASSGGLEHTCLDESAELLWKLWKKEITEEEFEVLYDKMFENRDKNNELLYKRLKQNDE